MASWPFYWPMLAQQKRTQNKRIKRKPSESKVKNPIKPGEKPPRGQNKSRTNA